MCACGHGAGSHFIGVGTCNQCGCRAFHRLATTVRGIVAAVRGVI